MPIFTKTLVAALALSAAGAHSATVLVSDTFTENGNNSALNYTGFANFTVTGNVDLVRSGDYGIACAGGVGQCVDLAGTSGPGQLTTKSVFGLGPTDLVTLTLDVSGPQRGLSSDSFYAGFVLTSPTTTTLYDVTVNGVSQGDVTGPTFTFNGVATGDAFTTYTISFRSRAFDGVQAVIGTNDPGNNGPILDNVSLTTTSVPEAQTWAMLIVGFGLVGLASRRRALAAA